MGRARLLIMTALLCLGLCACGRAGGEGSGTEAISNTPEIVEALRAGLREHAGTLTVRFSSDRELLEELPDLAGEWMELALEETGDPREGDYLRYQYGGYGCTCRYEQGEEGYAYSVELRPDYYLYLSQEEALGEAVARLRGELELESLSSDYEKVRRVYDYVCTHVRYDSVHRKNPHHRLKSTAYAALCRGSATCQGYSVLLYRLLREEGIPCRVVTGTARGEEGLHAWNLVELGGLCYQLDATWDAGAEAYRYFLRGQAGMEDHSLGEEFCTEAFRKRWPIAREDYRAFGQNDGEPESLS